VGVGRGNHRLAALFVLGRAQRPVPDRLRHGDLSVRQLYLRIGSCRLSRHVGDNVGHLLSLVARQIEHLDAISGNLNGMIMPEAIPFFPLDARPSQLLGHNELDLGKGSIGIGVVVDLADDLRVGLNHFVVLTKPDSCGERDSGHAIPRASRRWRTLSQQKLAELDRMTDSINAVRGLLKKVMTNCQCDTLDQCGKRIFQKLNEDRSPEPLLPDDRRRRRNDVLLQ